MKILQNEITGTQTSFSTNFGGKLSFIRSFLFSTGVTYIFTAPTCTTIIITLKPCAFDAEFQHFILRLNKISLLWGHTERGDRGWKQARREGEDRVTFWIILIFHFISFLVEMFWSCNLNVLLIDMKLPYQSNQSKWKKKEPPDLGISGNSKELIVLFSWKNCRFLLGGSFLQFWFSEWQ